MITYFSSVWELESKYLFSSMSALFSLGKYWGNSPVSVPASLCVLVAVSDLRETTNTNNK